mmetsp:Transcript_11631/g.25495  ORF Transcript_11631/g.25495 Transcript_11631/m.25495 type:complete len:470 (-) Transcript_11631:434-1843(-)
MKMEDITADHVDVGQPVAAGAAGWFHRLLNGSEPQQQQHQHPKVPQKQKRNTSQLRRRHTTAVVPENETRVPDSALHLQQRRASLSMDMMPHRPPPIPSSIHQMANRAYECDSSDGSVVSEVTMMTYSDEKAEMIKKEFLRRIKQQTKRLTLPEKQSLLSEILAEQEVKFKQQKEDQKQKKVQMDATDRSGFFEKRLLQSDDNEEGGGIDDSGGNFSDETRKQSTTTMRGIECRRASSARDLSQAREASFAPSSRRGSLVSFSSTRTMKYCNSNISKQNWRQDRAETQAPCSNANLIKVDARAFTSYLPRRREYCPQESHKIQREIQDRPQEKEPTERGITEGTEVTSETSRTKAHIDDIIELKLLVANQQATIDTVSSKLHNFELANRQRTTNEASKISNLEAENRNLAAQLNESREREISLRKELNLQHDLHLADSIKDKQELERRDNENSDSLREVRGAKPTVPFQ